MLWPRPAWTSRCSRPATPSAAWHAASTLGTDSRSRPASLLQHRRSRQSPVARDRRPRLPNGRSAHPHLLPRPLLSLSAAPGDALRNLGPVEAAELSAELREGAGSPGCSADDDRQLRRLGRPPIRPPAVRSVLQVLQREALGHPVPGSRRGLRRPANQEVLAGRRDQDRLGTRAAGSTGRWSIGSPIPWAARAWSTNGWPTTCALSGPGAREPARAPRCP